MGEGDHELDPVVAGLLLPLAHGNLLLPATVVVDLLGYPENVHPAADHPDWLGGWFDWRGLSLPLVSWERLAGQSGNTGSRKRVVVCHLFASDEVASFVGLEITGLPRQLSVKEADLQARAGSADPESCILAEVRVQDSPAYMPDLDALGKILAPFSG